MVPEEDIYVLLFSLSPTVIRHLCMPLPSRPSIFEPTPFCPSSFSVRSNIHSFCIERYVQPQRSVGIHYPSILLLSSSWCWRHASLYFLQPLSVNTDALFLVAILLMCRLILQGSLLTPLVGILLRQFVLLPQQLFWGIPRVSPESGLAVGLAPHTPYVAVAVAARVVRLSRNHQLSQNHQRFFPLLIWRIWLVALPEKTPWRLSSTPSRFSDRQIFFTTT